MNDELGQIKVRSSEGMIHLLAKGEVPYSNNDLRHETHCGKIVYVKSYYLNADPALTCNKCGTIHDNPELLTEGSGKP